MINASLFLSKKETYNKTITTQGGFDSLVIEQDDNIKLVGSFIGSIDVDQTGVKITGGTISGGEDISGLTWTDEGGGVFSTPMVADPQWLNIDGVNVKQAQTVAYDVVGVTGTDQVNITHADVSGFTDIIGSYIVFQSFVWDTTNRYTIIAYDGAGLVTLDRDRYALLDISSNSTYRLFNDEEYFLGGIEWIWRDSEIRISSVVNPSTLDITKSTINYGVHVTADNCKLKNITFFNQYYYGVFNAADNTVVDGCNLTDIRGEGVFSPTQNTNITVFGNTITDIGNTGIWFGPIDTIHCKKNTVTNVGMGANIGWCNHILTTGYAFGHGHGIKLNVDLEEINWELDANDIYVDYNIVDNCAYSGISLHIGTTGSIRRNIVTRTNMIKVDGGSIYTYHYAPTDIPLTDFIIKENFVTVTATDQVGGIYMDNRSIGNEIDANVVEQIDGDYAGIMINSDTETHDIKNNTVVATSGRALWMNDYVNPVEIYFRINNLVNDNILVVTDTAINSIEITNAVDPYAGDETSDNNYYVNPYGTNILNDGSAKTLSQLQSAYTQDANSVELTDYIGGTPDPDNEILLIKNPSDDQLSGTAPAGLWYDVTGILTTDYTIPAWGSLVLLKDLI